MSSTRPWEGFRQYLTLGEWVWKKTPISINQCEISHVKSLQILFVPNKIITFEIRHKWRQWKLPNFQDPLPLLSIYVQHSSSPLILDVEVKAKTPSPNDNQSIERKDNPRTTIVCYQVLPSGQLSFSVSAQLILSGFPLASFHLAEATLSAFSWLYTLVCVVVQNYL